MLDTVRQFFEEHIAPDPAQPRARKREQRYRLAAAALLVEVSRADYEVKAIERRAVADAVRRAFGLSTAATEELIRLAEAQSEASTSLYQFTRLINDHFSPEEKEQMVEMLWEVAFADGAVDKYEEHLVRKIAELVYVPHRAFIRAKHRAQVRYQEAGPQHEP